MSQRGATLIEVLISTGVVLAGVLAAMMNFAQLRAHQSTVEAMVERDEVAYDLVNSTFLYSQCGRIFEEALNTATIPNTFDGYVPRKEAFINGIEANKVIVQNIRLTYRAEDKEVRPGGTDIQTYRGTLVFEFEHSKDKSKQPLRPVKVPFVIKAERKNANGQYLWTGMKCSTETVEVASEAAQLCSLYGGTMVDGVSCDFVRFRRAHSTNPAVQSVTSANAHRYDLSDVLCYLDTLVTLIPDADLENSTGLRDYSTDYYRRTYVTRFCRKPGRVNATQKNSPNRNNITVAMTEASRDVVPMLQDLATFKPGQSCPTPTPPYPGCNYYYYYSNYFDYSWGYYGLSFVCLSSCSNPAVDVNGCPTNICYY